MLRFTIREMLLATMVLGLCLGWALDHFRAELAQYVRPGDLSLDQQLVVACYKLEVDKVVGCLRKGANVNARFRKTADNSDPFYDRWEGGTSPTYDWTPLIALASAHDYPDPPAELGQIWKDRKQSLALRKAIPQDQIDKRRSDALVILAILLSHRCVLDYHDGYGATALYEAVDNDKVEMVTTLLKNGANPNTKTGVYIDGAGDMTPLHRACHSKELLQLLLDHGADAAAKDSDGRTPGDWVALFNDRTFDLVLTPSGWRVQPREKNDSP
jgi:ankyrin repeat protein